MADLLPGYTGQFGPGLKALVLVQYHACNVAEPKLLEFLRNVGIVISAWQLSHLLIKEHQGFHAEKAAIYAAGLRSSPWQHLDQTSTRVDGVNQQVPHPLQSALPGLLRHGQQRSPEHPGCATQPEAADLSPQSCCMP